MVTILAALRQVRGDLAGVLERKGKPGVIRGVIRGQSPVSGVFSIRRGCHRRISREKGPPSLRVRLRAEQSARSSGAAPADGGTVFDIQRAPRGGLA